MRTDTTLQYYQQNATAFIEGTKSADMHDARTRFLKLLPPHAYILDFGCGSGRDAKVFLEQGYRVEAVDVDFGLQYRERRREECGCTG